MTCLKNGYSNLKAVIFPSLYLPTVDSIHGLLLLSRAPQDRIDTTVSKLFISSSVYIKTTKISYSKKDIFHLAP